MTRSREVSKGATRQEFVYTATTQQTTFTGNDDSSNSLSYTAGQIDVFVNGVRQSAADYTATNGTSVVLGAGASAGDTVNINAFGTFSVADVIVARVEFDYTATAGQTTFTGSDNDSQTMAYTAGRIDVYLNGSRLNVTDDYVATNGTSVVLEAGAQAGDSLVVVAHGTVNLASNILSGDLDLNGNELILDVDGDTTITSDTDDQIDIKIAGADDFAFKANKFEVQASSNIDMNGNELILDADGDTSITSDTDDQIDIKIAGADDFTFVANQFKTLSGSTQLDHCRPYFSAYLAAHQTVSTGTATKVTLNTESLPGFDSDAKFDASTNYRFTPAVAGYYLITSSVQANAADVTFLINRIMKNGSDNYDTAFDARDSGSSGDSPSCTQTRILYLDDDDYIELFAQVTSGGLCQVAGHDNYSGYNTYMSGCKIA